MEETADKSLLGATAEYENALAVLLGIPSSKVRDLPYLKNYFATSIGLGVSREQALERITAIFSQPSAALRIILKPETDQVLASYEDRTMKLGGLFHFQYDSNNRYVGMNYAVLSERK